MDAAETQILKKRLGELRYRAGQKGVPFCSDFLNLYEQDLLQSIPDHTGDVRILLEGGYPEAERRAAVFLPAGWEWEPQRDLPFCVLGIRKKGKISQDPLTHRDYLGALLHLGIERKKLGDILLFPEKEEYQAAVFAERKISRVILEQFSKVRHTAVTVFPLDPDWLDSYAPEYRELTGTVSSLRLDALMALAFRESRTSLSSLTGAQKVFVNGRLVQQNHQQVKEGDIISVRGYGRFLLKDIMEKSRKGRIFVRILGTVNK